MDEWALLLKMMTESRSYRPERPVIPITQPAAPKAVSSETTLSPEDRKLLDGYANALERCGTGKMVFDKPSGLYVPELAADCLKKMQRR
jgi:hypothetical protein